MGTKYPPTPAKCDNFLMAYPLTRAQGRGPGTRSKLGDKLSSKGQYEEGNNSDKRAQLGRPVDH